MGASPLRQAAVVAVAVLVHALAVAVAAAGADIAARLLGLDARRRDIARSATVVAAAIALAATTAGSLVVRAAVVALAAALLAAAWRSERARRSIAAATAVVVGLAVVLVLAGAALPRVPPARASTAPGPRVVVITVDTLRHDCGPGGRVATPRLDELARRGVTFTQARAPSPWTDPSLWALLGGVHPARLRDGAARRYRPPATTLAQVLGPDVESRALVTNRFGSASFWRGAHGWAVLESAGDFRWLPRDAALALPLVRGALRLRPRARQLGLARADAVTDAALAHLAALRGRPFLLWVHYLDPHAPYDPPPRFREARSGTDALDETLTADLRRGRLTRREDRERLRRLYEGEVRFVDEQVGRLLDGLGREELDDALVVLASDHGEEFWEHGLAGHGHAMHEELLRVPLVVKLPRDRHAGATVSEPVSLLDVLPTIADVAGAAVPAGLDGCSLAPALVAPSTAACGSEARRAFVDPLFYGDLVALLEPPWKLVHDPVSRRWSLFRLDEDPGETRDLATHEPAVAARMLDALHRLDVAGAAEGAAMDADTRDRLRAIGYVE